MVDGSAFIDRGLIKVCGLTDEAGVNAAALAGTDMIGFVFVEQSPRYLSSAAAARLADLPRGGAVLVGLFQNAALSEIEEVLERVPLDMLQLHGAESPDEVATIGAAFGLPVIKAVGVSSARDVVAAADYPADLMLYDAPPPEKASARGGHGVGFDWTVLREVDHRHPWLLAGGLTPDNAAEAALSCRAVPGFAGLDVSSGVEQRRGRKDPAAVIRFVAAARAAMAATDQETHHAPR